MIAAAMEEELETAKALFPDLEKIQEGKLKLWRAVRKTEPIFFLKTGIGPKRSAATLQEVLRVTTPSQILAIGYAGALDPNLRLGDLVAVERALAFSLDNASPVWENVRVDGEFELVNYRSLMESALSSGLHACTGVALTSSYVLGDPVHKLLLYEKFNASIVDMETAALARVAQSAEVPLSCIRVVSDEVRDSFLAPFSHDPSAGISARARKLIKTGLVDTYREWKAHSSAAKESLSRFLSRYL